MTYSKQFGRGCFKHFLPTNATPVLFLVFFSLLSIAALAQTDPCLLTATYAVSDGETVKISDWFPTSSIANGEVIDIGEGSTLVINKSFTFNVCKIRCAEDAIIITQASTSSIVTLGAIGTIMLSCNNTTMWRGITVSAGTRINFSSSQIYDARSALSFPLGYQSASNRLVNTKFANNIIGINVGGISNNPTNSSTVGFTSCYGNVFTETSILNNIYIVGSHALAGILVTHANIVFGSNGSRNIFENMTSGIRLRLGSTAVIANCDFKGMFTSASYTNSGVGVEVSSSSVIVTKTLSKNCRFENNQWCGVHSNLQSGDIRVEYANFSGNQQYGILMEQVTLDVALIIKNNIFSLNHKNCRSAIFCNRPPGITSLTNSFIQYNQIIVPSRGTAIPPITSLIEVHGNSGGVNSFEISHNNIDITDWISKKLHGITVIGLGDNYMVQNNDIHYAGVSAVPTAANADYEYGDLAINFSDMPGTGNTISHNHIRSILTYQTITDNGINDRSLVKCGIHINSTNAPIVCDNDIDSTYRGIHFGGSNFGTILALNKMRTHVFGIQFLRNTIPGIKTDIDDQEYRENTWSTNTSDYIDSGKGAIYKDGSLFPDFVFRVDPNSGIIGQLPPSADPTASSWFFEEAPEGNIDSGCTSATNSFTKSEINIAKGEYPYITPVEDWDLQRHLWTKILRNPDMGKEIEEIVEFIGDPKDAPTSPHLFAEALYNYEKAFYPDSAFQIEWNNSLLKISAKKRRILGLVTTLGLDTLVVDPAYADSLESACATLDLYQDTLRILLDSFVSMKNSKLVKLAENLSDLPSDYPWEKTWLSILEVAIRHGQGIELDSFDYATLLLIANACPEDVGSGGKAVLQYLSIDDAYPYMLCGNHSGTCEEERNIQSPEFISDLMLFPNPAQNNIIISIKDYNVGGHWEVISASGSFIKQGNWSAGESSFSINLSTFTSGLYVFQSKSDSGHVSAKRFNVIR